MLCIHFYAFVVVAFLQCALAVDSSVMAVVYIFFVIPCTDNVTLKNSFLESWSWSERTKWLSDKKNPETKEHFLSTLMKIKCRTKRKVHLEWKIDERAGKQSYKHYKKKKKLFKNEKKKQNKKPLLWTK